MTTQTTLPAVALLLDCSRGIYIPQHFAKFENWKDITEADKAVLLSGPEHEIYWDTWQSVLDSAYWEQDGKKWTLYQDGDLWALCLDLMTDEEKHNFGFDEE